MFVCPFFVCLNMHIRSVREVERSFYGRKKITGWEKYYGSFIRQVAWESKGTKTSFDVGSFWKDFSNFGVLNLNFCCNFFELFPLKSRNFVFLSSSFQITIFRQTFEIFFKKRFSKFKFLNFETDFWVFVVIFRPFSIKITIFCFFSTKFSFYNFSSKDFLIVQNRFDVKLENFLFWSFSGWRQKLNNFIRFNRFCLLSV